MLILSRKAEQTIRIGENIRVTILGIQGNRVKVGLEAPGTVRIVRGELQLFDEEQLEAEAEPEEEVFKVNELAIAS